MLQLVGGASARPVCSGGAGLVSAVSRNEADEPDDYRDTLDDLQERYAFYIMNPAREKGVEYSLWVREDDAEFPVINSNTGGFVTFNSRSEEVGDALELTEEFFMLVGFGFHEAMCFIPPIYFRDDHFARRVDSIYDGHPRNHEVWLAHILIDWMCREGQTIPELRPLCEWASGFTEFGMPRLGGEDQ